MKTRGYRGLMLLPLVLLGLLSACNRETASAPAATGERQLLVVASIAPVGDFARQVGGDRVRVEVLIPPGTSPHTYEPTPAQLKTLSRADVLLLNGVGLEFWKDKVLGSVENPHLRVVTLSRGLHIEQSVEAGKVGGNPHLWLDVVNAIVYVTEIRATFVEADPAGGAIYAANSARYIEALKALDRDIMLTVASFPNRKFIAFHPAWIYFARRYGLEEAAVVEQSPGREPSPADIAHIVAVARSIGAKAIFAEPQFSSRAAKAIAEESGARVLFLNPLGDPPDFSYIRTMRHNLKQLQEGMAP